MFRYVALKSLQITKSQRSSLFDDINTGVVNHVFMLQKNISDQRAMDKKVS